MASERLRAMDWKAYNHNLLTQDEVDALSREFGGFFLTKTMTELFEAACERNLMLAPANTAREIVASEQLAARDFFVDVEHPGRGTLRLPGRVRPHDVGRPGRHGDRRARPGAAARRAHRRGAGRARRAGRRARAPARGGRGVTDLFAGTTILEFGGGAAGPVATRYFADHGADRHPRRVAPAARLPAHPEAHAEHARRPRRRRALRRAERQQALGRAEPVDARRRRRGAPARAPRRRGGRELRARRDGEVGARLRVAGAASAPTWS